MNQRSNCQHSLDLRESKGIPEQHPPVSLTTQKPFTVWIATTWKILKEIGIPNQLTCLLRNLYQVKKQQLEPHMKQLTSSKLGKEYDKAVYCHSVYLTYIQSECMHVKLLQSYSTFCDPMDHSLSDSFVHGIYQARILEWVATSSSRGSSQPKG